MPQADHTGNREISDHNFIPSCGFLGMISATPPAVGHGDR